MRSLAILISQIYLTIIVALLLIAIVILAHYYSKDNKNKDLKIELLSSKITEKDTFIGVVAHDLRSPLHSSMVLTSLLFDSHSSISEDEIQEYGSIILSLGHRMEHLINNMLDATKIETGNTKLFIEPTAVKDVLEDVSGTINYLGVEKGISTKLSIPDDVPNIMADYNALVRVLENLISNAYKFSPNNSIIEITIHVLKKNVRISVKDEGPGMTKLDKAKLFTKFGKLSATPTGNEKSTGLGLYIVKNLISEMKGNIKVESEVGKGSTFSILFKQE